jgi:hypothetical protein
MTPDVKDKHNMIASILILGFLIISLGMIFGARTVILSSNNNDLASKAEQCEARGGYLLYHAYRVGKAVKEKTPCVAKIIFIENK